MNEFSENTGPLELIGEKRQKSDDTTGIFVSLYLIVLAFFVVMNSISNQDQNKVNAATESVTRAFKNPFEPEADFVDVSADEEAVTPNDEFHDQILGVFASLVGFEGKFPTRGGNILKVDFNAEILFEDDSSEFRAGQLPFLKQLSTFLAGGRDSEKREIDFVVSSGKNLPSGPNYWLDNNILRAGAFIHQLGKMGVAENQMSMGIMKGRDNLITATFYNRERINAIQDLGGHEAKKMPPGKSPENSPQADPASELPELNIPDRPPILPDNQEGAS